MLQRNVPAEGFKPHFMRGKGQARGRKEVTGIIDETQLSQRLRQRGKSLRPQRHMLQQPDRWLHQRHGAGVGIGRARCDEGDVQPALGHQNSSSKSRWSATDHDCIISSSLLGHDALLGSSPEMTNEPEGIGLLRSFTNHPARLMWTIAALAATVIWWSVHFPAGEGWAAFLSEICRIGETSTRSWSLAAAFASWATMSLAMMLPSALPMISAYLDISDAARRGNKAVAPAAYLVAGYLAVWLVFAAAATGLQSVVELTPAMALADEQFAAALLLVAGLYQFAPLKHACLSKCRAPMPYFLARWSDRVTAVFRMGAEQGALCLACCWALMLLMFVAGLMNVIWMAGLAILIALEKTLTTPKPIVYGSGAGLIAAGLFALLGS